MGTNNLTVKKGRCINFGNCNLADSKEIIEINLGDDFICPNPHCRGTLVEVKPKPKRKWILYFSIAFMFISIVLFFSIKSKIHKATDLGNSIKQAITNIDEQNDQIEDISGIEPTIRYSSTKEIISSSGEHFEVKKDDFFIGTLDKNNNPENGKIYDKKGHLKHIILPKSNH